MVVLPNDPDSLVSPTPSMSPAWAIAASKQAGGQAGRQAGRQTGRQAGIPYINGGESKHHQACSCSVNWIKLARLDGLNYLSQPKTSDVGGKLCL